MGELRAQEVSRFATPFIAPGHWTLAAARRLQGLGLTPAGHWWGTAPSTLGELSELFESAAARAEDEQPAVAALARAYRARFAEEFGPVAEQAARPDPPSGVHWLGGWAEAGYVHREGAALAGIGYANRDDWTGPILEEEQHTGTITAGLAATLGRSLALTISPRWEAGRAHLGEAHGTVLLGPVGVWVGRRGLSFGPGMGGGVVLGSNAPFDGAGMFLAEPVGLPGWLDALGPVRFEVFGSQIENGDRILSPWFAGARASLQPHPRLGIGVNRAVMFGGEGNTPITLRNLAFVLIGKHSGNEGEFDNQVVSVDAYFRPPFGAVPVAIYMEWGLDDSAGAWKDVPGIVAGVEIPALPSRPEVGLGLERTYFAPSCCGNTIWYRNWAFRGGWTDVRRPLGHRLGGHGSEWLLRGHADLYDARLRIDLQLLTRVRGAENLFAPDRAGRSTGAIIDLTARFHPATEASLTAGFEDGAGGWREVSLRGGVRMLF